MILADGMMGQMMEPVVFSDPVTPEELPPKPWILDGAQERPSRIIKSLILDTVEMEEHNWKLARKYKIISGEIPRAETYMTDDARLVIIAYGTAARIARGGIRRAREMGLKVGLLRPITLWPFPDRAIREMGRLVKDFMVFEMNTGQMIDDVRLSLEGRSKVHFYGRPGGIISTPDELGKAISSLYYREHLREA